MGCKITLTDAPEFEPITLEELKAHLRIDSANTDEDDFLTALLTAARRMAEKYTRRTIPLTGWSLWLDQIPDSALPWWDGVREGALRGEARSSIDLPRPPLVTVEYFKSYAEDDTATTFAASGYYVSAGSDDDIGRIVLRTAAAWPIGLRAADAFEINFTAGYPTTEDVPEDLKTAIKTMAAWMYSNRGDCEETTCVCGSGASMLLSAFRIERIL